MQRTIDSAARVIDKPVEQSDLPHNRAIQYFPAIDGLRGLAILFVLWYHSLFLFPQQALAALRGDYGWFSRLAYGGWMGVDLFFVISGFLMCTYLPFAVSMHWQLEVRLPLPGPIGTSK